MDSPTRSSTPVSPTALFTPPAAMPAVATAVEICVESLDEAVAAEAGGASRIELCASLDVDGLTPSPDLLAAVRHHLSIPVFVLVRPRAGDFAFNPGELAALRRAIMRVRVLGADGIVTGALTADGRVDEEAMPAIIEAARPLPVTFHRAIDRTPDPIAAIEALLSLGVDRVLTSGGAPTAREGARTLAAMVRRAGEALTVMAGGRVRADHAAQLVRDTGVRELHAHLGSDPTDVAQLVASVARPA
jgi:copper homeostasis protein